MTQALVGIRNQILSRAYSSLVKPYFFQHDPEDVHDHVTRLAEIGGHVPLGKTAARLLLGYSHPSLAQTVSGICFRNPMGLSAGFDKDARLTHIMPYSGFGFMEVGSVTGEPCVGNPRPRLWRLKNSQGLMVWYGLKNDGAEAVARRMHGKKFAFPVGVSLAKTNSRKTCSDASAIADYVKVAREFADVGDYFTINISCPNTYGGEPFVDSKRLDALLTALDGVQYSKPTFIKLSPDLPPEQLEGIFDVAEKHSRIDGFVCSNLTKVRDNPGVQDAKIPTKGGMSGKPLQALSDELVRKTYLRFGDTKVIIGVGGIFTAEDAYRKIRSGASLLQLITGMIYQGPQSVSEINRGLVRLLKRDGFTNISEAVGADFRKV